MTHAGEDRTSLAGAGAGRVGDGFARGSCAGGEQDDGRSGDGAGVVLGQEAGGKFRCSSQSDYFKEQQSWCQDAWGRDGREHCSCGGEEAQFDRI